MTTTLELVDRAVDTPMPRSRRRRFWLLWWLWGIFGTAFSLRGVPDGTWLAVALLLTSPFWALFLLWPCLWLRDRLRARSLWAESVSIILAEAPDSTEATSAASADAAHVAGEEAPKEPKAAADAADPLEDIAIPVVIGRTGVLVPLEGWRAAFPTIGQATFDALGVATVPADTFPGVHLEGFMGDALTACFANPVDGAAVTHAAQTPHAALQSVSRNDLEAASRWCAALRHALALSARG